MHEVNTIDSEYKGDLKNNRMKLSNIINTESYNLFFFFFFE